MQINLTIHYLPARCDAVWTSSADNSDTETDIASGIAEQSPDVFVSECITDLLLEDFLDDLVSLPELGNRSETLILSDHIPDIDIGSL